MLIAEVLPLRRLRDDLSFDYAIPPAVLPELTAGSLVLVPFGRTQIKGLVTAMKRKKTSFGGSSFRNRGAVPAVRGSWDSGI
ncbi:hypothetical protein HY065_02355 [Candidatus Berkelbacteria bacterium]|nr:hypothetical protein [Candidatus Berkelbacteria bacterium]